MKAVNEVFLADRVYEELRRAILSGELAPGSLHSVVEISQQLGVSRTPVREALLQFAANGVVRFERSRGVRILEVTTQDIEEIYSLRLFLEVPAAYIAARRMSDAERTVMTRAFTGMTKACDNGDEPLFQDHDVRFHTAVLRGAGNERVVEAVAKTRAQMHARGLSTASTRTLNDILEVHREIFDAIQARDPERSAAAVRSHLTGTMNLLISQSRGGDDPVGSPAVYDWFEATKVAEPSPSD